MLEGNQSASRFPLDPRLNSSTARGLCCDVSGKASHKSFETGHLANVLVVACADSGPRGDYNCGCCVELLLGQLLSKNIVSLDVRSVLKLR